LIRFVDPVRAGRRENVDVDRVFNGYCLMRHVGRNTQKLAGSDDNILAVDRKPEGTFLHVRNLLVNVAVHRDHAPFFEQNPGDHNLVTDCKLTVEEWIQGFDREIRPTEMLDFASRRRFSVS
jgi:hypothetical protein